MGTTNAAANYLGSTTGGGGTSTEVLSNYKLQQGGSLLGGGGGIGGTTTEFDSISQLSQKAYSNALATTRVGGVGDRMDRIGGGDLTNLETSDTSLIDYNITNEQMKYRANVENMYKKGMLCSWKTD